MDTYYATKRIHENGSAHCRITDGDTGEVRMEGEARSSANENLKRSNVCELAGRQKLYLWEV